MQRLPLLGLGAQSPHHHHPLVAPLLHLITCHAELPMGQHRARTALLHGARSTLSLSRSVDSIFHRTLAGPLAAGRDAQLQTGLLMGGTRFHPGAASNADSPPALELPYLPPDPHLFATKLGEGKICIPPAMGRCRVESTEITQLKSQRRHCSCFDSHTLPPYIVLPQLTVVWRLHLPSRC